MFPAWADIFPVHWFWNCIRKCSFNKDNPWTVYFSLRIWFNHSSTAIDLEDSSDAKINYNNTLKFLCCCFCCSTGAGATNKHIIQEVLIKHYKYQAIDNTDIIVTAEMIVCKMANRLFEVTREVWHAKRDKINCMRHTTVRSNIYLNVPNICIKCNLSMSRNAY